MRSAVEPRRKDDPARFRGGSQSDVDKHVPRPAAAAERAPLRQGRLPAQRRCLLRQEREGGRGQAGTARDRPGLDRPGSRRERPPGQRHASPTSVTPKPSISRWRSSMAASSAQSCCPPRSTPTRPAPTTPRLPQDRARRQGPPVQQARYRHHAKDGCEGGRLAMTAQETTSAPWLSASAPTSRRAPSLPLGRTS